MTKKYLIHIDTSDPEKTDSNLKKALDDIQIYRRSYPHVWRFLRLLRFFRAFEPKNGLQISIDAVPKPDSFIF